MNNMLSRWVVAWGLLAVLVSQAAQADEGMWLFNSLPKAYLKSKYGFTPTDEWANHVMLSSVRFNSGGSASFVSSTGLVLHKLSTADNNYYRDGFYARTHSEELKAPDLELNQLVSIEDVTERVSAAVKPGMSAEAASAYGSPPAGRRRPTTQSPRSAWCCGSWNGSTRS